jgi:hypothetical protein
VNCEQQMYRQVWHSWTSWRFRRSARDSRDGHTIPFLMAPIYTFNFQLYKNVWMLTVILNIRCLGLELRILEYRSFHLFNSCSKKLRTKKVAFQSKIFFRPITNTEKSR